MNKIDSAADSCKRRGAAQAALALLLALQAWPAAAQTGYAAGYTVRERLGGTWVDQCDLQTVDAALARVDLPGSCSLATSDVRYSGMAQGQAGATGPDLGARAALGYGHFAIAERGPQYGLSVFSAAVFGDRLTAAGPVPVARIDFQARMDGSLVALGEVVADDERFFARASAQLTLSDAASGVVGELTRVVRTTQRASFADSLVGTGLVASFTQDAAGLDIRFSWDASGWGGGPLLLQLAQTAQVVADGGTAAGPLTQPESFENGPIAVADFSHTLHWTGLRAFDAGGNDITASALRLDSGLFGLSTPATPVPEPGSWALLAAGLLGVALRRGRPQA